MAKPEAIQTLLLAERHRFHGKPMSSEFQSCSRKMSRIENLPVGESSQLKRHFQFIPKQWPVAALCRQAEQGDADTHAWFRADPIYVQAEMQGARVMVWDNLALAAEEQSQILSELRPVFGDFGFELSASSKGFFYVRALNAAPLPDFIGAVDVLGCDLTGFLPTDKKYLALFNECQVILHNHPLNAARSTHQQTPINALWFWGQGSLPSAVQHHFSKIFTDDFMLSAFLSVPQHTRDPESGRQLIDARKVRDWAQIEALFDASKEMLFDFADGVQWHWQPRMKWFFWRRNPAE